MVNLEKAYKDGCEEFRMGIINANLRMQLSEQAKLLRGNKTKKEFSKLTRVSKKKIDKLEKLDQSDEYDFKLIDLLKIAMNLELGLVIKFISIKEISKENEIARRGVCFEKQK